MPIDIEALVRKSYACYPARDRQTHETLIAPDFHFTSPYDDRIDRAEYFRRCWPNCETIKSIEIDKVFVQGNEGAGSAAARPVTRKNAARTERFMRPPLGGWRARRAKELPWGSDADQTRIKRGSGANLIGARRRAGPASEGADEGARVGVAELPGRCRD
jgi:hypothetical protein